ncbi:hypothetical protein CN378_11935 [Bacillus sp. AFS015802]|uniref:DUF3231 family protein n=1 Tax=Bacillus sp. AFS015802 TaxID=2033486 RepID=UPI000BF3AE4A|nr:DUF3231 family protein [Bacillus sp. AFS015802]PFA67175.1 hypothetical protein CN378_11935 [Bacillus sp. AFS015802]
MTEKKALNSSELATLWMTYQQKTMIQQILEYLIEKADDEEAKNILVYTHTHVKEYVGRLVSIFEEEGCVVPAGFTEEDVNPGVPILFGHSFDIMFLRQLKAISMGLHTLHLNMSYRKDLILLYKELTGFTQTVYEKCMDYLKDKDVLPGPPAVTLPKSVEFAQSPNYMAGFNIFSDKRTLNTVEVAYLYFGIESNTLGMQMMTGFAQVANEPEVKKYFIKGKELSKKIIREYSKVLMQSDIQAPATSGARATDSTISPFSDKLVMYCTSLFTNFGLGSNALGTAFSLRSDLPVMLASTAKDILAYGHDGGKIMAKNGWLEQPPSMEDRNKLFK